jgi:hypothetical protein
LPQNYITFSLDDKIPRIQQLSSVGIRRVHVVGPYDLAIVIFYNHAPMDCITRLWIKVFSTGILKISVVTDKQEYRIYQKFIGDRNKISKEI